MKILTGIGRGVRASWAWLRRVSPWWPGRWKRRAREAANLFKLQLAKRVSDDDDWQVRFTKGGHMENAMEQYVKEVEG